MSLTINELVQKAHANARAKGFWDKPRETGTLLMLIVSEVAEALDSDSCANFCEELADICIRIFDMCGGKDIDLEGVLLEQKQCFLELEEVEINIESFSALEKSMMAFSYNPDDEENAIQVIKGLSYALEWDRKSYRAEFELAMAMAFLYTLKWVAHKGYSIENDILEKMEKNAKRPRLHGKKY